MTDQGPHTYRRWHHQRLRHKRTEKNDTCRRPSIPHWSTDQHRTEEWTPEQTTTHTSRRRQRHTLEPNVHTHDTQDKYLQTHHNISLRSSTRLESSPDGHCYQLGYLTAGKYPHLPHLFHYGCIGPHSQSSTQNHYAPVKNFTSNSHRTLV